MGEPGSIQRVRTTAAPSPIGPWTVTSEPVFTSKQGDWDMGGRWIVSLIRGDDEYLMFYESYQANGRAAVGMATSPDGLQWTKYDDSTTQYPTSDPVFKRNSQPRAWDDGYVWSPVVRMTNDGWEMFYSGAGAHSEGMARSSGYATSLDGVTWVRHGDAPLLDDPGGVAETDAVVDVEGTGYLYYTTLSGIKVATITCQ